MPSISYFSLVSNFRGSLHSFVLSQVFSFPVIILQGKAFIGGKGIENIHGNIVDFLLKNKFTQNTAIVEIKTPKTPILGPKYRGDVYNISSDIVGAVMQANNYKHHLQTKHTDLRSNSQEDFDAFNPECLVVAGNLENEQLNQKQKKSFELFRNGLKDVRVITYDELFGKVKILIELLEGGYQVQPPDDEEFIPF